MPGVTQFPDELDLLEPNEVARLLGCGVQTLAAWRSTRRVSLPYVRVSRLIRYRRSDVAQFIATRLVDTGPAVRTSRAA